MKKHNKETCKSCISVEGEDMCFDDLEEMLAYDKAQQKWYESVWDAIYYPCWRMFDKIRYFPKEIKWFIQRGYRGWSDQDAWDVHGHIANIMPQMLRQMKENSYGCPVAMYEDVNKYEYSEDEQEVAAKKWNSILDTIIRAFEIEDGIASSEILDLGPRPTKKQKDFGKIHSEKFGIDILTKEDRKIQKEGWKNFQKYFQNLWD